MNHSNEVTVQKLHELMNNGSEVFLLDVREQYEYNIANLGGYLIPLSQLSQRMSELDNDKDIVVHCHHGARSARAVRFLQEAGFTRVRNLVGGINEWSNSIDPNIPKY